MKSVVTFALKCAPSIALSLLAVGCASALSGGGLPGKIVNDVLPANATIYTWDYDKHGDKDRIIPGTEDQTQSDIIWISWDTPVPCSDIKGVDWWVGGESDGEIGLPLANARYGNQYIPAPPSGEYWLRPELWIDKDSHFDQRLDFTRQEALSLAEHCGVELQVRR